MRVKFSRVNIGKKKGLILVSVAFFSAIILVAFYANRQATDSVALVIEEKKYSKTDVEKYIKFGQDKGLDREQAINGAIETLKYSATVKKLNISYDKSKADEMYDQLKKTYNKGDYGDYLHIMAEKQVVSDDLQQKDIQKGHYFEFYYGQHIQTGPENKTSGVGDKELINRDKEYAKSRADYYYNLLKNNKVSSSDVYSMVQKEIQNNPGSASALLHSKAFGGSTNKEWRDEIQNKEVISTVLSTDGTSEIKIREGSVNIGFNSPTKDVAYYIISKSSGNNTDNLAKFIETTRNIRVERKV